MSFVTRPLKKQLGGGVGDEKREVGVFFSKEEKRKKKKEKRKRREKEKKKKRKKKKENLFSPIPIHTKADTKNKKTKRQKKNEKKVAFVWVLHNKGQIV